MMILEVPQFEYYDSVDWQMLLIINTLHLTV
jgi:hypothetical protein